MRRAAKVDNTQPAITKALRDAGMTVQPLHVVGKGCPDLIVGWRGKHNVLLEVKTGDRECDRKLTQMETDWHAAWNGQVAIVSTPEEAVLAVMEAAVRSSR